MNKVCFTYHKMSQMNWNLKAFISPLTTKMGLESWFQPTCIGMGYVKGEMNATYSFPAKGCDNSGTHIIAYKHVKAESETFNRTEPCEWHFKIIIISSSFLHYIQKKIWRSYGYQFVWVFKYFEPNRNLNNLISQGNWGTYTRQRGKNTIISLCNTNTFGPAQNIQVSGLSVV